MTRQLPVVSFAKMVATNPAKLFGLYPKKGTLQVGSDADIIIIDPSLTNIIKAESQHTRCDYNCYEGKHLQGRIEMVILAGKIVINRDKFLGAKGDGKYLKRNQPARNLK
jgi:dihydropyrimidinase